MDNEEEVIVDTPETNEEVVEEAPSQESAPKAEKPKRTPQEELEYFEGRAARIRKDLGLNTEQPKAAPASQTGVLDETALDYLDLKGISEAEDIKVIEDVAKKTGMTVRNVLKDDYVQAKLKSNAATREVKAATPSATRRTGNTGGNDLQGAIAKYEASGFDPSKLPEDFALRMAVVDAVAAKQDSNKPGWR